MNTTPYYHLPFLLADFRNALDTALEALDLSVSEADWLRRLADESATPESMRVEVQINAQPLASSCLIIHHSDPARQAVYLYSPLHGVQGFDTLAQLESSLQAELAHLQVPSEPLQFVEQEAPVFEQWCKRLLQQQIDLLDGLSNSLCKLPTLRLAVEAAVRESFATLLEGVQDIPRYRLQIVADDVVVRTEALCDAATKVFTGEALGVGLQRRFLRGDATVHEPTYDLACQDALAASAAAVPAALAQAMRSYWADRDADSVTDRRENLALVLANTYARTVSSAAGLALITTAQMEWLRQAIIPATAAMRISTVALIVSEDGEDSHIHLADSLVLADASAPDIGIFLFSTLQGLRHFADQQSLTRYCIAADRQPGHDALSQQDRQTLQRVPATDITLSEIQGGIFPALADSLIALIERRLAWAVRFPGAQSSTAAAVFADALDIRRLIDQRLVRMPDRARWLTSDATDKSLPALPALPSQSPTLTEQIARATASVQALQRLRSCQPDVRATVRDLLASCISVMSDGELGPDDLQISQTDNTFSLVDYFLARLCSTHADDLSQPMKVLDQQGTAVKQISADELRAQLEPLTLRFSPQHLQRLKNFDRGALRIGKGLVWVPETRRSLYESHLRLELDLAREEKVIDSALLDLLQDALDRPQQAPQNATFRVRGLQLEMPGKSAILTINCAFVLQRAAPGAGALLLWSPLERLTQFEDEPTLLAQLDGAFEEQEKLHQWLDLVNAEDLRKWHTPSVLPGVSLPRLRLTPASLDLFEHLEANELDYRSNTRRYYLSYAIRGEFDPLLLEHFVDTLALQCPLQKPLKHLQHRLQNRYFQSLLPAWLQNATAEQLTIYALLVQADAKVSNEKFNYLFDVSRIHPFASTRLEQGLRQDYPEAPSDPNRITITFTHFTPNTVPTGSTPPPISADTVTTTKSLIEFALTHNDELGLATTLKASYTTPGHAATELDMPKIRRLVDHLDIGTAYQTMLAAKLSPQSPDHQERRRRYSQVVTAYLMEEAYQYRLENKLSSQAMQYVSHILIQPDALARTPIEGKKISIGQLQLRASAELAPDPVSNIYVIGPEGVDGGPLVLYRAYLPGRSFTEFAHQDELHQAILNDPQLQLDILDRVPEAVHKRYNHGGFLSPHIGSASGDILDIPAEPAPVQLIRSEISGNALHHMFEANSALLNELASARTVTTAQAKWQDFLYLASLGIEQFSFFLPGKLAVVLNSLQGVRWLNASHDAALKHNWGEALAEFVTALSGLAAARAPNTSVNRKIIMPELPIDVVPELTPPWSERTLKAALQDPLSSLQARNVQLKDLVENTALGLYLNAASDRYFAAVDGAVYEVSKTGGAWRIIDGEKLGPALKRVDDQWQIDWQGGLRGGGAVISVFDLAGADAEIEERFTKLAEGMPAIARYHPIKHAMLVRAYSRARFYLETCMENLNTATPNAPLPPSSETVLRNTFGQAPSEHTVNLLRDYTKRLLSELLSPSMDVMTSKRIVTGVNVPGCRDVYGFVHTNDPKKRIFFTERAFDLSVQTEAYATPSRAELLAHQQAVTLIHELSHLVLKTVDIAYVDALSPFVDQFSRRTAGGRRAHQEALASRRDGLSLTTSDQYLFKTHDNLVWRDTRNKDGRALGVIYRLSKKRNLVDARRAFYTDPQVRTDIIMANADSLALLISKLGRRQFAPAG
jgi:hypothetical protein